MNLTRPVSDVGKPSVPAIDSSPAARFAHRRLKEDWMPMNSVKPYRNRSSAAVRPTIDSASATADDTIDYKALFNLSPIPTFILKKRNGKILLIGFNRAAAKNIRNIVPSFIDASIERVFVDFPGLISWLKQCFAEKGSSFSEMPYRVDDADVPVNLKFVATYAEGDLLVVHLENIHKQRQAEADLRKSKERLELAIYATDSGLWDWHLPSGEVIFGEQWAAILGYTIDEIKPHISTWQQLLHPEDKPQVTRSLERHLSGELPRYESEHRLLGKNGNWVWVLDVGKVVERDAQNAPLRMTGTKVDISGRKKMEAELARLNAELEKRIVKRTRKLKQSERSLIRSQAHLKRKSKHLQEVNSALKILLKKSAENKIEIEENILANIKELVQPYLGKIEEKSLTETQKVYLGIIRSNLDEIISPFSRQLTTQHLNLTPAEISVAKLIKQGKSTKEIAALLCLSGKTIETQRRSIRRKMGLNGRKINLKTYLDEMIQ
jgi:PAS domain S-box-containing protein